MANTQSKKSRVKMNCTPNVRQKNLTFGGAFFMSKYSKEFKLEVIKYCIEGHHSARDAMEEFNLPTTSSILLWVNRYKEHGVEGILKNPKSSYSGDFKVQVIQCMYANHWSYVQTANHFRIGNHKIVKTWEQILKEEGPEALCTESRGRKRKMPAKRKTIDKDTEKALRKEIEQLKMENEYLKKLNALVQERIKRENKKK